MEKLFEHSRGDEMSIEEVIVYGLSDEIKFLARDEDGGLWASKEEPTIEKDSKGNEFVAFPLTDNMNDMHSLSAFNHLFEQVEPLSIVDITKQG